MSEGILDLRFVICNLRKSAGLDSGYCHCRSQFALLFAEIHPKVPRSNIRTLPLKLDRSYRFQRVTAEISASFVVIAMFVACCGICGVTSYWVSLQTGEIGARMALRARLQMISLILRQTAYVLCAAITVGVPLVMIGQRMFASQVHGLASIDRISIAATGCLLLLTAAAAFSPSPRATTINPVNALRND